VNLASACSPISGLCGIFQCCSASASISESQAFLFPVDTRRAHALAPSFSGPLPPFLPFRSCLPALSWLSTFIARLIASALRVVNVSRKPRAPVQRLPPSQREGERERALLGTMSSDMLAHQYQVKCLPVCWSNEYTVLSGLAR